MTPTLPRRWWESRRCWRSGRGKRIWIRIRSWRKRRKTAERALVTVDTDIPTAGIDQARLDAYKGYLKSEAYAILGTLSFNAKNWAEAETNLRKSIDALPQQPDPIAVFRLAVALDMQSQVSRGVEVCQSGGGSDQGPA